MAESLGVAVIGLGVMGKTHAAAIVSAQQAGLPCRLVAVADRHVDGHMPELANLPRYPGIEELLADGAVDAVSICTPTDSHVAIALACLAAGKHVLVEKPVALRSVEVAQLADAAAKSGRICMPAMCMRFWPGWTWLKERIESGAFGAVRSATFQRLGAPPDWSPFYSDFSRSGGPLFDLHIHDADFVRYAFGEPLEVVSTGSAVRVATMYRFGERGPASVVAEGGQDLMPGFPYRMRYLVAFEKATADWELSRDPQLILARNGKTETISLPTVTAYEAEVRHFVELATGRVHEPVATIADAVRTTALLEAEKRSLETRAPVRIV
jgi:predicted dehydrogenase